MSRRRRGGSGGDYTVGYGRPPEATRFKPGQSGNPLGRPKGSRSIGAMLQRIVTQRVAITENGRTRRVPAIEVMLRRLANDALQGNQNGLKLLLALVDRYGEESGTKLDFAELAAEDRAILGRYLPIARSSEAGDES